ncbi:pyruvate dehydrogenase complex dihydrolipoyllysine-residue acetyltransferase [Bacillaceae bacterium]
MAVFEFKLPDIGEGIHEGEIVKWHVKPGDTVKEDDVILEVQNDKAVVEIPSPVNGKVLELKVDEGTVAVVGDVLVTFEVEGAGNAAIQAEDAQTAEQGQKESQAQTGEACAVGAGVAQNVASAKVETSFAAKAADRKVLATPGTRKLARELGIDISQVPGTGRNGRITREDVMNFAQGKTAAAPTAAKAEEAAQTAAEAAAPAAKAPTAGHGDLPEERVPLKGIRKVIANAMVKSMYTAPHVTLMDEADVSKLVELRQQAKPLAEKRGTKLTYLPFIVKAVIGGLRRFPVLNASLDDEKGEIVYKKYYHIGIATDTENGLLVPVIFNADRKNIWTVADEIRDLAARGREGKLAPEELKGSTFTITNIGSAGGMFFTPVINYPEVAILGTGRITEKPVVRNGEIVVAPVMALSLSFDHRLIDGATAQNFLNYVKQLLEDPQLLVMEV